ncbi:phospholipase A2 [Demequina sp. NBRC 110054]|uniref:phospholipase A2 n=1 Tax=Demequina sp. NBRC 110054 TaxID=1570343 RepID=UPI000A017EA5|nr:phospholipase A2 [Demequina sp. NBRC 110054]
MSRSAFALPRPLAAALALALTLAMAIAAAPSASAAATPAASVTGSVSVRGDSVGFTATRDGWGAEVVLDLSEASRCTVVTTLVVESGPNVTQTSSCDRGPSSFTLEAGYGLAITGVKVTLLSGWRVKSSGLVALPEPVPAAADAGAIADVFAAMDAAPTEAMILASDGCSVPSEIEGLLGSLDDLSDTFFLACVLHDYGYAQLGNAGLSPLDASRAQLDKDFRDNMLAICPTLPAAEAAACDVGASTFYTAVRIGGGAPFYG